MKINKFSLPTAFWILFYVFKKQMDREWDVLFLYVDGADKRRQGELRWKNILHCEEDSCDGDVLSLCYHLANILHLIKSAYLSVKT